MPSILSTKSSGEDPDNPRFSHRLPDGADNQTSIEFFESCPANYRRQERTGKGLSKFFATDFKIFVLNDFNDICSNDRHHMRNPSHLPDVVDRERR